jgi:radical SAM superfamily enzyme YgiQ (UPF0313 family)
MKLTIIKPNIGRMEHSLYVDEGRMEPLNCGVLAGLTPPHVDVALYDDRLEEIPYDEPTDLVAITVETYTARRSYEIAAEFRARGVKVIMGGFQPTLIPEETLQYADSIFIGDAETKWADVIADFENGRMQRVYQAEPGVPQVGGSMPRRDLFKGKGYLPITLMQFSRGCRFACDFCAIQVYFKRTNFVRRTKEVLDEIAAQDRKFVFFVDDNFLSNHEAAKAFLRDLIPMKIRWVSQASIDMTNDPELMELLEASGCYGNVIGFESISPMSLKEMKKGPNFLGGGKRNPHLAAWDKYQEQCEVLRKYHLQTWAAFTLGYDHDTVDSIKATLDFAMYNKFCFSAFNILMPYPGVGLYEKLAKENRHLYGGKWWLHPEYRFNHAAFQPKNMTADELTEAAWYCRSRWNTVGSIFRRMWDFKTHLSSPSRLGLYLGYNPIFAKEVFKKNGMLFGLFRKDPERRATQAMRELMVADEGVRAFMQPGGGA